MDAKFEALKTQVIGLSAKQRKELGNLLATLESQPRDTKQTKLYDLLRSCIMARTSITYDRSPKLLPSWLSKRLHEISPMFEQSVSQRFPDATPLQREGVRVFLINMAISYCQENELQPTLDRIVQLLYPIDHLIDAQLPGYREGGYLQEIVLQQVTRGKICLAKTQSESKS